MRLLTLLLVIVGGIDWGLLGIAGMDVIAEVFGAHSLLARGLYVLIGLAALYQLVLVLRLIDTPQDHRALG